MVTLIAKLKAKPGKEALLAEECMKIVKEVREKEKNCLMYVPHISIENPAVIIFVEKYVDQEALEAHFQTPYFKALVEKFGELLAEEPELHTLNELI